MEDCCSMETLVESLCDQIASIAALVLAGSDDPALGPAAQTLLGAVLALTADPRAPSSSLPPEFSSVAQKLSALSASLASNARILADSVTDPARKDAALAAVNALLADVVHFVVLEDQLEVAQILVLAASVHASVAQIGCTHDETTLAKNLPLCGPLFNDFIRRVSERVKLCEARTSSRTACENALKTLIECIPLFVGAVKKVVVDQDEQARTSANALMEEVNNALVFVTMAFNAIYKHNAHLAGDTVDMPDLVCFPEEELYTDRTFLSVIADVSLAEISAGGEMGESVRAFVAASTRLRVTAEKMALFLRDPISKGIYSKSLKFFDSTWEPLCNPQTPVSEMDTKICIRQSKFASNMLLISLVHRSDISLGCATVFMSQAMSALKSAIARGGEQANIEKCVLKNLTEITADVCHLAASSISISHRSKVLLDQTSAAIHSAVAHICEEVDAIVADNSNTEAVADLDKSIEEMINHMNAVTDPSRTSVIYSFLMRKEVDSLLQALTMNQTSLRCVVGEKAKSTGTIVLTLRGLVEKLNAQDVFSKERRAASEAIIEETNRCLTTFVGCARSVIDTPTSSTALANVERSANDLKAASLRLVGMLVLKADERSRMQKMMLDQLLEINDGIRAAMKTDDEFIAHHMKESHMKKKISSGMGSDILDAAKQIVAESYSASKLSSEAESVYSKICETAEFIVELAAYTSQNDQLGFLVTVRNITNNVCDVLRYAQELSDCTAQSNPTLFFLLFAARDFTLQLKVFGSLLAAQGISASHDSLPRLVNVLFALTNSLLAIASTFTHTK